MLTFDTLLLARLQFAYTISFHIIFPALSIGLASFLAVLEWRWLRTNNQHYYNLYKFWIKIFAVSFGLGVVSGVVMSYQFGTNWSVFSDRTANVIGPLLGFEVLTAFFLEASFLGIMLFGWGKVSRRMHFSSTCIVAFGTLISAFWIRAANSWMQTPQGFSIGTDGRLNPTNWIEIIFNPSFPYRLLHMVTATYLCTAFIVGGIGAYYLRKSRHIIEARIMLGMAVLMTSFAAPFQLFVGDKHGLNTLEHQPAKVAAMEGIWDTEISAPLRLFAWPNQKEERNHYELTIPYVASLILTHDWHGKIKGLKEWPVENRPPVFMVFWSFRVMVGIGMLMIVISLYSSLQYFRKKLFTDRYLHICWMLMTPSGFIALLAGWFVTEIGRQPYTVYGVIRTHESLSPAVLGAQVAWSLATFVVLYTFIFSAAAYYIAKLIQQGITAKDQDTFYTHGIESAVLHTPKKTGKHHV